MDRTTTWTTRVLGYVGYIGAAVFFTHATARVIRVFIVNPIAPPPAQLELQVWIDWLAVIVISLLRYDFSAPTTIAEHQAVAFAVVVWTVIGLGIKLAIQQKRRKHHAIQTITV